MKIIYISALASKSKMNGIIENSKNKPLQSIQKFHRLMCEGFVKNNVPVKTISSIPMSRKISGKILWLDKCEEENGVKYTYIPFINIKVLRQICTFLGTIVKVTKEVLNNKKEKIFICDILNTTISTTTLILSKIFKFQCWAIVTDLPRDMQKNKKINEKMQTKYDGYILITEEMNKIVNPKNKPYIVIEGLVDIRESAENNEVQKSSPRVIMYAGGLYEKYGVKTLIEAFCNIQNNNIKLDLYGDGDLVPYIKSIENKKIDFHGVVTNDKIVEAEKKATLLVNPRFTSEEYTKYSFPSKNMEYMVSGTPVLTTKLPGMPEDYYQYVYFIENETVTGIQDVLNNLMNLPENELIQKGIEARNFILNNKNNVIQSKKIIKTIEKEEKENNG